MISFLSFYLFPSFVIFPFSSFSLRFSVTVTVTLGISVPISLFLLEFFVLLWVLAPFSPCLSFSVTCVCCCSCLLSLCICICGRCFSNSSCFCRALSFRCSSCFFLSISVSPLSLPSLDSPSFPLIVLSTFALWITK